MARVPLTAQPLPAPAPQVGPADYEQMFSENVTYIRALVSRLVPPSEVEDAASEVILKFFTKDALSWYDGAKVHHIAKDGTTVNRTASFRTFLRSFVLSYGRQCQDKVATRARRESLTDYGPSAPCVAIEVADVAESVAATADARRALSASRAALVASGASWTGTRPLVEVWDASLASFEATGAVSRAGVAAALGCSVVAAGRALAAMHTYLGPLSAFGTAS